VGFVCAVVGIGSVVVDIGAPVYVVPIIYSFGICCVVRVDVGCVVIVVVVSVVRGFVSFVGYHGYVLYSL